MLYWVRRPVLVEARDRDPSWEWIDPELTAGPRGSTDIKTERTVFFAVSLPSSQLIRDKTVSE